MLQKCSRLFLKVPKKVLFLLLVVCALFFYGCSASVDNSQKVFTQTGLLLGRTAPDDSVDGKKDRNYYYLISPRGYQYILSSTAVNVAAYSYFTGKDVAGQTVTAFGEYFPDEAQKLLHPRTGFKAGKYTTMLLKVSGTPPSPGTIDTSPNPKDTRYCTDDISLRQIPTGISMVNLYMTDYANGDPYVFYYYNIGTQFPVGITGDVSQCSNSDVGLPPSDEIITPFHDQDGKLVLPNKT